MKLAAALAALLVTTAAFADEKPPTPEEIKRVMEYFENGKGKGPILTGFQACLNVDTKKDSPTRFECVEPVSGPLKKMTPVHAWVSFFVPKDDKYDDVSISWLHEGKVRETSDLSLNGSWRTRTYKSKRLDKAGKWEIKVQRGGKDLATAKVDVTE